MDADSAAGQPASLASDASGGVRAGGFACVAAAWRAHEGELRGYLRRRAPVAPIDALADCLSRTLGELPAEDAAILRACDLEGQTQRAFAEAQGLSLPAVKSRLLRARQRLRERIAQACQVRFEADGRVGAHVPRPPLQGLRSIP